MGRCGIAFLLKARARQSRTRGEAMYSRMVERTARRAFEAVNRGDCDTLIDLCREDVVHRFGEITRSAAHAIPATDFAYGSSDWVASCRHSRFRSKMSGSRAVHGTRTLSCAGRQREGRSTASPTPITASTSFGCDGERLPPSTPTKTARRSLTSCGVGEALAAPVET